MSWLYGYRLCSFSTWLLMMTYQRPAELSMHPAVLALALGIGVVALSVETLVSWAYVLIDSDRDVYALHARVGAAAGLVTATSVILQLVLDSCHRPVPIAFDLAWSPILAALWAAVAVLSIVGAKPACAVDGPDANDICKNVGPIAALSGVIFIIRTFLRGHHAGAPSTPSLTFCWWAVLMYALGLLLIASMYARQGTPVWTCPVIKGFESSVIEDPGQESAVPTSV
ncbi:hypothetical protein PYCCODRAFT_727059 [Trametes coccinea BRFM310]|uniref:Uncharacterized protein n=1 Tax=Trametes coccinea (strain BRFM310) TaxID=1353009 RepID=A0A1Y2IJC4_TRAC3|nr:hypothetical protein PYCCODRAFT_727059 [Trametes coccinea BRFM310]